MSHIRIASKSYPDLDDDGLYDLICNLHYQIIHRQPDGVNWLGYGMQQWPQDLVAYQEIIYQVKPHLIIETGTGGGGCPLFWASILDLMKVGDYKIVTIDYQGPQHPDAERHPHIICIRGYSTAPEVIEKVKSFWGGQTTMVFLDSDHTTQNVSNEMEAYGPLVSVGSYMVVEDTIYGATTVHPTGPAQAVAEWLRTHPNWVIDGHPERWMCTQHPFGWLRRVS